MKRLAEYIFSPFTSTFAKRKKKPDLTLTLLINGSDFYPEARLSFEDDLVIQYKGPKGETKFKYYTWEQLRSISYIEPARKNPPKNKKIKWVLPSLQIGHFGGLLQLE